MEKELLNDPVPWLVAEAVCQRIVRATPKSLYVLGDPDGRVIDTVERLLSDAELAWTCDCWDGMVDELAAGTEQVVCLSAGLEDPDEAWKRLRALARACRGSVIWAEPVAFRRGIGIAKMRHYDSDAQRLVTEELPDGGGGTRHREAWEPRALWMVAEFAAWRLEPGAETVREQFVSRLPYMSPIEVGSACDRILARWPHAHELLSIAIAATASHGHSMATAALLDRMRHCPGISASCLARHQRDARAHGVAMWRATEPDEEELSRTRVAANFGPDEG